MKRYVKNNSVFTVADIRKENPTMSIPNDADLSAMGYEFLVDTPMPVQDGFYAVEVAPINNVQTWELRANEVVVPQTIRITPFLSVAPACTESVAPVPAPAQPPTPANLCT